MVSSQNLMINAAGNGHIILFSGAMQQSQLLHLRGGAEVWTDLHVQCICPVARHTGPSAAYRSGAKY
jgi:hypothetical protein